MVIWDSGNWRFLSILIFIKHNLCFAKVALHLTNILLILLLVSSRVTFNQQFCRWRCFSFYWFGKREFVKFTNGIPVIGGSAPSPPILPLPPTSVHINYDFILSKSLNKPNLYINWDNMWYPGYQNKKLNLCMLNNFEGFHLCIKWAIMSYPDNQVRNKLYLCMPL